MRRQRIEDEVPTSMPARPDVVPASIAPPSIPEVEPLQNDLPPVEPGEFLQAIGQGFEMVESELPFSSLSRRASAMSSAAQEMSRRTSSASFDYEHQSSPRNSPSQF